MNDLRRFFLILTVLLPATVFVSSASWAESKLVGTLFSYDGKDFVRTDTTMMDKDKSAAGTKLDHESAAYKALSQKQSYSGPASVFGKEYDANYAPLISADGKLTGAVFVGTPK